MRKIFFNFRDRPYYHISSRPVNRATTFGYGTKYDFTKEYFIFHKIVCQNLHLQHLMKINLCSKKISLLEKDLDLVTVVKTWLSLAH